MFRGCLHIVDAVTGPWALIVNPGGGLRVKSWGFYTGDGVGLYDCGTEIDVPCPLSNGQAGTLQARLLAGAKGVRVFVKRIMM